MSKKTNLLNFDKEIASSIGLYEAIVLQIFKSEKKQNLTFLKVIIFWINVLFS